MEHQEAVKRLGELIEDVETAMLTTADQDGTLRSRPMATQQTEFDGTLWFFTRSDSEKMQEIGKTPAVNLSYANPEKNRYISVSGTGSIIRDRQKAEELWNPILKAWFPEGLEDPALALLKVDVEKAEYWDSPSSKVVQLVGFVKALATGQQYSLSDKEHQKVNL